MKHACLLALALAGCVPPRDLPEAPPACFADLVTHLATDEMEGRGVGTQGLERAADYVEDQMRAIGLEGGGVGYRQPFDAITGVALGKGNTLSWGDRTGVVKEDFTPMGFSSSGAFGGPVVFAGYGIRAGELDYDDYDGVDVTGKVVLALRYEPGEKDEDSPFDGNRPSRWSDLRLKALEAREAGAAALVFVTGPAGSDADEPDGLPPLKSGGPTSRAGLPVLQVTRAVASEWLAGEGHDLGALQAAIDADYTPHSADLPSVRVEGTVDVVATTAPVSNVVGVLPGRGALAQQVVVVGAHYDHLGYGGDRSMRPDEVAIHNGADDNASGVAAMLCGVRRLVDTAGDAPERRTLLALAFTAEEIGVGGSNWYVRHPLFPLEQTVAMVNLDMVGRVREGKLQALGTDSAPEWEDLLRPRAQEAGLEITTGGDGYGPSDQLPFYEKRVPVVHFFSGAHEEYHTPDDDAETLNMEGGGQVAALLADVLGVLTTGDATLTWQPSSSGPTMAGDSRGYGAYLGTIPDYSAMMETEGGVLLSGVRTDGPADRAGIRGGDRIVAMAGVEIQNLYDMTFVLRDNRPGESIEVVVLRDGERISLLATLGKRGESPEGGAHPGMAWAPAAGRDANDLLDAREVHLADLRQLTDGGENAEAYFSPDGRSLIFQRTPPEGGCDQEVLLDLTTGETTRVSSGKGRTTCGYFAYPGGERVIYATTEGADPACPPLPDLSRGYVWPLYDTFELVWQDLPDGTPEPFLPAPGYDAEATLCMQDGRVLFTSVRNGDLDLYVANADGTGLRQLTDTPGYDGGGFFTPDCSAIVWRASRPEGRALEEYRALLSRGLVRPSSLEIYWMDADGTDVRQLTDNGAANFAPYPMPDNSGVLFSSNLGEQPREFDIHRVSVEGGETERITFTPGFDGFPMFSPDGKWLVFGSNRANPEGHETNLFIARWVP